MMRRFLGVACLLGAARFAGAQTRWDDFSSVAERNLLDRLLRAEDARAHTAHDLATMREGLKAKNPALRRYAVRGLGRLERAEVLVDIVPMLDDSSAVVRAAAADALAQAASHDGTRVARAALAERAGVERDAQVLGMIAESMGRLTPTGAQDVAGTAEVLASLTTDTADAVVRGATRGLFFLSRRQQARGALPLAAVARLERLLDHQRPDIGTKDPFIRATAAAALVQSGAATLAHVRMMLDDPDPSVREKALARLGALRDTASVREMLTRALADTAPIVRFRAIPVYARMLRVPDGCRPLVAAMNDANLHVVLAAIDALAMCRGDSSAMAAFETQKPATVDAWHVAAHSLVTTAAIAPQWARARLAALEKHPNFFARTYAARAARLLGDDATLLRLARAGQHPNVRSDAIDALSALRGHQYDTAYARALTSDNSPLLQSAARALRPARDPAVRNALLAALDRVTALKRENSRDARVALLNTIRTAGDSTVASRLKPYLRDFDPAVADSAASILASWTGTRPAVAPVALPAPPIPSIRTFGQFENMRATIEMADGGHIELRLFPLDAPTNVWRFVRLARAGYFNGLTWHRVVPWFVVQGGSPGANEYVGDAAFSRDEVGLENQRGTVGLSTRGRDTGDGQLYFNTVDNTRLDHDYTILAEVVSGMDVVDRIQEGAKIQRIVVK